ncbi:MAG: hypothetical protein ACRD3T_20670, partial [Terriglobia bacterium]
MEKEGNGRLDSWKEIADYLHRDVTTAIRWGRKWGLPVHRVPGGERQAVFAYRHEIDAWMIGSGTGVSGSNSQGRGSGVDDHRGGGGAPAVSAADGAVRPPGDGRGTHPRADEDHAATDAGVCNGPLLPRRRAYILAGVGTLAIVGVLIAAVALSSRRMPPPELTAAHRLTHDRLEKYDLLHTDGSRVYFCEDAPQGFGVSYVSVEGGDAVSVPSPFQSIVPYDLSPDGSKLLMGSPDLDGADRPLWIMPATGGSPQRVGGIFALSAAWSPDGSKIAYTTGTSLYTASIDGSEIHRLATLPNAPEQIRWSPDGQRLWFDTLAGNPPRSLPWEIAANGSGLRRVLPDWGEFGGGFLGNWTPDGRYYVFSVLKDMDVGALWAMRERRGPLALFGHAGSAPVRLGDDSRIYYAPVSSRDGHKLFVIGEERSGELVRYDRHDSEFVPYLNGLDGRWVIFSPDGRWVAYSK